MTRVSCQHLQNVSLSICWENAGKMSGRRRPAPAQRGIMEFFDVEKRQVSNYNVCYLIHLIVALVAMCILGSLLYENRRATTQFCRLEKTRWQFNGPVIEYSMKLSLTFQNSITPMMRITMRTMKKRKCSERLCQPCLLRPGIRYVKFHFVFYTKHAIFKIQ